MAIEYRLLSSDFCFTPNVVRMAQNEYRFGGQQAQWAVDLLAGTYFKEDRAKAEYMLRHPECYRTVEDTVIATLPEEV